MAENEKWATLSEKSPLLSFKEICPAVLALVLGHRKMNRHHFPKRQTSCCYINIKYVVHLPCSDCKTMKINFHWSLSLSLLQIPSLSMGPSNPHYKNYLHYELHHLHNKEFVISNRDIMLLLGWNKKCIQILVSNAQVKRSLWRYI
jgi:hypothetical protein